MSSAREALDRAAEPGGGMTAILAANCSASNSDPSADTDHPDRAQFLRPIQYQDRRAERRLFARSR
jgi:hypothetical protein